MLLNANKIITYWKPTCDCGMDVQECPLSDLEECGIPICSECGCDMEMDRDVCYNGEYNVDDRRN